MVSQNTFVYPKRTWLLFDMIAILRIDNHKIEDRLKKEDVFGNRYKK